MIAAIIIVSLAFGWLLKETKGLTIRLTGAPGLKSNGIKTESDNISLPKTDTPYWWQPIKDRENCVILCQHGCDHWRTCKARKGGRWTAWKIPARTIKAYGSTMHFAEGCNILRVSILKDVAQSEPVIQNYTQNKSAIM